HLLHGGILHLLHLLRGGALHTLHRHGRRGRGIDRGMGAIPATSGKDKHGQGSSGSEHRSHILRHAIRIPHDARHRQRQQTIPRPISRTQAQGPTTQPSMLDLRTRNRLRPALETPNVIHLRPPSLPSIRRGGPWRGPTSTPQLQQSARKPARDTNGHATADNAGMVTGSERGAGRRRKTFPYPPVPAGDEGGRAHLPPPPPA